MRRRGFRAGLVEICARTSEARQRFVVSKEVDLVPVESLWNLVLSSCSLFAEKDFAILKSFDKREQNFFDKLALQCT